MKTTGNFKAAPAVAQVGRAFLEPYDLNSDASTFTAANTSGPVHQALQGLNPQEVQVYTYRPYSPADNSTMMGLAALGSAANNNTGMANSRWALHDTSAITGSCAVFTC